MRKKLMDDPDVRDAVEGLKEILAKIQIREEIRKYGNEHLADWTRRQQEEFNDLMNPALTVKKVMLGSLSRLSKDEIVKLIEEQVEALIKKWANNNPKLIN